MSPSTERLLDEQSRSTQKGIHDLGTSTQRWRNTDDDRMSSEANVERYRNAVAVQKDLPATMHNVRQLKNQCIELVVEGYRYTMAGTISSSSLRMANSRLKDTALQIASLQEMTEAERQGRLDKVKGTESRRRRRRSSQDILSFQSDVAKATRSICSNSFWRVSVGNLHHIWGAWPSCEI